MKRYMAFLLISVTLPLNCSEAPSSSSVAVTSSSQADDEEEEDQPTLKCASDDENSHSLELFLASIETLKPVLASLITSIENGTLLIQEHSLEAGGKKLSYAQVSSAFGISFGNSRSYNLHYGIYFNKNFEQTEKLAQVKENIPTLLNKLAIGKIAQANQIWALTQPLYPELVLKPQEMEIEE